MHGSHPAPPRKTVPPLHPIREFALLSERRRRNIFVDARSQMRFEETRHLCNGCKQSIWFNAEHNVTVCRTEECPLHKPAHTEARAKFMSRIEYD